MGWDSLFSRGIPLNEAAEFFFHLTKKAEWTEPPDMTGELEGQFAVPVEQVLHQLKSVIAAKFRLMIAYFTYAQSFNDHAWRAIKTEFYEHAEDEQEGAEFYLKRAAVLGGPVLMDHVEPPPPSTNPDTIFTVMARAEQEGIAAQRILRQMVGEENPMKIGIEEQLVKDQHHLDELFQMMSQECRLALEQAGASPPEAMAPNVEASPTAISSPETSAAPPSPEQTEPPDMKVAVALMKMAKTANEGGEEGRRNALYFKHILPAENASQLTAALVASRAGKHNPEIGAGIGGIGGVAAGRALGLSGPHTALAGLGGAALGGAAGLISRKHERSKQFRASLQDARAAHGATSIPSAGANNLVLAAPDVMKQAAEKSDEELKEVGRQRAVANLSAEAHREKGRRGERFGQAVGSLAGAAGGAVMGKKLVGGPAGTLGGAAAGYLSGGRLGKEIGTEHDIKKNAAVLTETARDKIKPKNFAVSAKSSDTGEGKYPIHDASHARTALSYVSRYGSPSEKAKVHKAVAKKYPEMGKSASVNEAVALMRKSAEEFGGQGEMSAPSARQLEPTNYLRAEMVARRAQQLNEANFYRERLAQTQSQTALSQQQIADMQMQLQQAQEQQANVDTQLQQYAEQAAQAQAQATQAVQEAANARMAAHQFRAQILQAASQDPEALGPPPMPGQVMAQDQAAQGAVQQQVVDPNAQAAQQPPQQPQEQASQQAQGQPAQPGQSAEQKPPSTEVTKTETTKTGSLAERLVGGGLGAVTAGGSSLLLGQNVDKLRNQVQTLSANEKGTFFDAARQAAAKAQLAHAELSEKHPMGAAAMRGVGGAIGGAMLGPGIASAGRQLLSNVRGL